MPSDVPAPEFLELIRPHTGNVTEVRPTAEGNNSAATFTVESEGGPFFVKGVPNRPGGRRASLIREALINPHVLPLSPALKWQVEDEKWIVLGYEVVAMRTTDFKPGSADLPVILGILREIGDLPLPEVAADWPETRWNRYVSEDEAKVFEGQSLLYTDIHPNNFLIDDQGNGRAIDWSWPTRGAEFIGPACLVLQLIAAGHSPESAEALISGSRTWADAGQRAIDTFVKAQQRSYHEQVRRWPDRAWLRAMVGYVDAWAEYRGLQKPAESGSA